MEQKDWSAFRKEEGEMNILEVYNKLCTVSYMMPDYHEDKKGFDMCLLLFKKALKHCPSVNHIAHIDSLKRSVREKDFKISQLKEIINNFKNKQ